MKAQVSTQSIDAAKKKLEEAMYEALLSLGSEVNNLSFFCTTEEAFVSQNQSSIAA